MSTSITDIKFTKKSIQALIRENFCYFKQIYLDQVAISYFLVCSTMLALLYLVIEIDNMKKYSTSFYCHGNSFFLTYGLQPYK